jgi:reactive intermediate/imine deaminase
MPTHHVIPGAPRPVGPFCHAAEDGGWVMLTGQMPTDPDAPDAPLPEGLEAQAVRVMDNLAIVLAGLGLSFADVTMCRVYLTEFKRDFAAFNQVYTRYFEAGRLPARTAIGVTALAVDALVEVDCIARRPDGAPV